MSDIEAGNLFQLIGATYNELTEILVQLVSKHALEHPAAGSGSDPNTALAKVLSQDVVKLKSIKSTSWKENKDLIFSGKSIRRSIEIDKLDCSLLLDILLKFPGFMQVKSGIVDCTHKTNSCCGTCDHSSTSCKKDKCPTKCKHMCINCRLPKDDCVDYSKVCQGNCTICLKCNIDRFDQSVIKSNTNPNQLEPCRTFSYWYCLVIMVKFRNIYGHLFLKKCEDFISKNMEFELEGWKFNDENRFKEFLHKIFNVILDYVSDPSFMAIPMSEDEKDRFGKNIECILTRGKSLVQYHQENFKNIERRSNCLQNLGFIKENLGDFSSSLTAGFENMEKKSDAGFLKIEESNEKQLERITGIETNLGGQKEILLDIQTQLDCLKISQDANTSIGKQTDNKKLLVTSRKRLKLQLEKNCGGHCIFFIDAKITKDNVRSFMFIRMEEEDDGTNQANKEWEDLDYNTINKMSYTYLITLEESLESGYTYSFKLELNDGDVLVYENLAAIENSDCYNEKVTSTSIILIAYNNGKQNNVHDDKFEEEIPGWVEKFKMKRNICKGAHIPAKDIAEFRVLARRYYRNVPQNVQQFPPTYLQRANSNIAHKFETFFDSSVDLKIILNPSFVRELNFFGLSAKDLKDLEMQDMESDSSESDLLIAHFKEMLIMIICICDSENVHDVKNTLKRCNANLKAIRILHEESLTDTFAAICGVVACPSVTKKHLEEQSFLYDQEDLSLFLTKEDLKDEDSLSDWWGKAIYDKMDNERRANNVSLGTNKESFRKIYETIVGETMAIMSISDVNLPKLSKDTQTQVTSLMLNFDQQCAIGKGSCIVNGPFGSGKSLVLREIARRLCRENETSSIYFLSLDPFSLLEVDDVNYLEGLKKSAETNGIKLCNMQDMITVAKEEMVDIRDLPTIIEHICITEKQRTSFVLDEVDGELFSKDFADRLKVVIDENKYLHQIVLAPQSMRTDREVVHHNGEKSRLEANQFERTGLKIITLPMRMRMTREINNLIQVTEKWVQEFKTSSRIPNSSKNKVECEPAIPKIGGKKEYENNDEEKIVKSEQFNVDSEIKTEQDFLFVAEGIQEEKELRQEMEIFDEKEENESLSITTKLIADEYKITDEILGDIQSKIPDGSLYNVVQSRYLCQSGNVGHNVQGKKPQLIFLNSDFEIDSSKSGKVLSSILKSCLEDKKRAAIICSNLAEAHISCYSLQCLKRNIAPYFHNLLKRSPPIFAEKEKLWNAIGDNKIECNKRRCDTVLITDHRSFRGCETEHCITFVSPESVYTSHILVEILTRAIAHVDILVLPVKNTKNLVKNNATLQDVVDQWKESNNDGECIVEISSVDVEEKIDQPGKLEVRFKEGIECIDISCNDENDYAEVKEQYRTDNELSEYQTTRMLDKAIYLHINLVNEDAHHRQWEVFINSDWQKYSEVLQSVTRNRERFQTDYGISIKIDETVGQILILGNYDATIRFKVYIYGSIMKPFISSVKDIFCKGLYKKGKVTLKDSKKYPGLCSISTNESLRTTNLSKQNLYRLILKRLRQAKKKISNLNESMCCIMLHGGKMFSKLTNGTYTMEDVFIRSRKPMVYKRLVHGDLNIDKLKGHIRTVYRYDMIILTPNPVVRCRCKIYLRKNEPKPDFITYWEAGDKKPPFSTIPAWPVYIDFPGEKINRLDIVDPTNGLTTRVNISVSKNDKEYEKDVQKHLSVLQEKVFDHIETMEGTLDLKIPKMPEGYILCFLRRSERNAYRMPNAPKTILTTSSEKIILNYEDADYKEVMDIFIDDEDIIDTLDQTDWKPEEVAKNYLNLITLGNQYLQKYLNTGNSWE